MTISSRTPEGDRFRCDICGKTFCLTVSTFPCRDVTCPHCGCLSFQELAHSPPAAALRRSLFQSRCIRVATLIVAILHAALWLSSGIATSLTIHFHDGTWLPPFFWLVAIPAYGLLFLPLVEALFANLPDHGKTFWVGIAFGWGLVAGAPTGVLFGTMLPLYGESEWSSNVGASAGLLIGPFVAATFGLTLVGTINFCLWLLTGHSLSEKPT